MPVDEHFSGPADVHVLEHDGKVYSATLNQTNMMANNNKYYILQVLEMDNGKGCFFYSRWGRVGARGQISLSGTISRDLAIREYDKKFYDKHIKGEYRHLSMNYGSDNEDDEKKKKMEDDKPDEPAAAVQPESKSQPYDRVKSEELRTVQPIETREGSARLDLRHEHDEPTDGGDRLRCEEDAFGQTQRRKH